MPICTGAAGRRRQWLAMMTPWSWMPISSSLAEGWLMSSSEWATKRVRRPASTLEAMNPRAARSVLPPPVAMTARTDLLPFRNSARMSAAPRSWWGRSWNGDWMVMWPRCGGSLAHGVGGMGLPPGSRSLPGRVHSAIFRRLASARMTFAEAR